MSTSPHAAARQSLGNHPQGRELLAHPAAGHRLRQDTAATGIQERRTSRSAARTLPPNRATGRLRAGRTTDVTGRPPPSWRLVWSIVSAALRGVPGRRSLRRCATTPRAPLRIPPGPVQPRLPVGDDRHRLALLPGGFRVAGGDDHHARRQCRTARGEPLRARVLRAARDRHHRHGRRRQLGGPHRAGCRSTRRSPRSSRVSSSPEPRRAWSCSWPAAWCRDSAPVR